MQKYMALLVCNCVCLLRLYAKTAGPFSMKFRLALDLHVDYFYRLSEVNVSAT